jgi:hypothetical protein
LMTTGVFSLASGMHGHQEGLADHAADYAVRMTVAQQIRASPGNGEGYGMITR